MRWLLKEKYRSFGEQVGFTLIEVLFSLALLGLIGVGLLSALNTSFRASGTLGEQVVATNLAVAHIEAIKESSYALTYPNAGDNITVPFQYNVVIDTVCSTDGGTNFSECTGSESETLQMITVAVSREGRPVFSVSTYRHKS